MAFEGLTEKISATFKKLRGKGRLKESDVKEAMREIRLALLEADVSYKVVKDFIKSTTERCVGTDVLESLTPAQMIVKIVNEEMIRLMGSDTKHITTNPNGPTVIMLVGLQGAGDVFGIAAHEADHFLIDDLDDHLSRGERFQHFGTDAALGGGLDKVLDHFEANVSLQQSQTDLSHGLLHIGLLQAALAAELLEGGRDLFS